MDYQNVDYSYQENFNNEFSNGTFVIESNGEKYNVYTGDSSKLYVPLNYNFLPKVSNPALDKYLSSLNKTDTSVASTIFYDNYFLQRPDVSLLYDDVKANLDKINTSYNDLLTKFERMSAYVKYSSNPILLENYESLKETISKLEEKKNYFEEKLDTIITDVYEYNNYYYSLKDVEDEINKIEEMKKNVSENVVSTMEVSFTSDNDRVYYSKICDRYDLLLEKRALLKAKIYTYISGALTLDDISFKVNGYNSEYGVVPAGEYDTWCNPNYSGEGHVVGMTGVFEGPHGKETGYDSRIGATKANYTAPDTTLIQYLSMVTDEEGNYLYPIESFEKGGEYYYHIFGVNDDGSINPDLVDNPRFGCKMLGRYLAAGADQRERRARGSLVMTSMGNAITFDYGFIPDLDSDPNHIDISMDKELFWLSDYPHNQDKVVSSLALVYKWCTPNNYVGVVDYNYEYMERLYINNINTAYNKNYTCLFDRDDFENVTNFDSQEAFVYQLTLNK